MRQETGGIVTGWLAQLVVIMAVLAFIGYEVIATALNAVAVEDTAVEVARRAATTYRDGRGDEGDALEVAQLEADERGAELLQFEITRDQLTLTVRKQADTLLIDRLGVFDGLTTRTATIQREISP